MSDTEEVVPSSKSRLSNYLHPFNSFRTRLTGKKKKNRTVMEVLIPIGFVFRRVTPCEEKVSQVYGIS